MGWKATINRWALGPRARRLLAKARSDLDTLRIEDAVAARTAVPMGKRRRPLAFRALASAVDSALAEGGEHGPCLVRGLALLGEARRFGFDPVLVVGVRKGAEGLESHAWLDVDGRPFTEDAGTPGSYETLTRLPRVSSPS